jgi:hypothetical protein
MKPDIDNSVDEEDDSKVHSKNGDPANKPYERKRTANLENLIGNLKVRKMNQTPGSSSKSEKNNKNMTSLYVEVTNNSLSDCSRSTPPLSSTSPSVSPSSISPDSPIQSNVSSSLSSISSSSLATPANHNYLTSILQASGGANNNTNTNNKNSNNNNQTKSRCVPSKFEWALDSTKSSPIKGGLDFVGENFPEFQLQALKQATKLVPAAANQKQKV